MAQATVFIYALNCPTTRQTRYVGKSVNPSERFRAHLKRADEEKNHRANWIRSLLSQGLKPELEILDEVPDAEWPSWEVAYIEFFRERGFDLVNSTPGGEDPPTFKGRKLSSSHRAKLFAASVGRKVSPETRAKIRAALLGKKLTPEHCAAMSAAMTGEKHPMWGKKQSPESVEKSRLARTGKKLSLEHCAALRAAAERRREKKKDQLLSQ